MVLAGDNARRLLVAGLLASTSAVQVEPTCSGAAVGRFDLGHVVHNNLGGAGPDSGDPRVLRFDHVATVDGSCVMLEMQVADGGYYTAGARGATKNGVSELGSRLGVLNVQAQSRVDINARFLDCATGAPARMSKFNFTFYGVNAPATRQITVRSYWAYFLDNPSLFQKEYTDYGTTFVDATPCIDAVGTEPCALTYFFQDANEISMTLETLGPAQPFFFGGSLCQAFHLPGSGCSAEICDLGYRLRDPGPTCVGAVCRMDECCERAYDLCSSDVCGYGHTLKVGGARPERCDGEVCLREECCVPIGVDSAGGGSLNAAFVSMPQVASCQGHERQWHDCEGLPECNQCVPQDCNFDDWSEWSSAGGCSGLCKRKRTTSGNNACGTPCDGPTQETVARVQDPMCYPEGCKVKNVDCMWAEWSEWTHCKEGCTTCMLGQSYRERQIAVKSAGSGKSCAGSWNMTRPCKLSDALDCKTSEWAAWTECSQSCGTGWKFRRRRVLHQAEFGGKPCGASGDYDEGLGLKQTHACNVQACSAPEPCMLDIWTDWAGCDAGDKYQKFRSREILMPAMGDNRHCNHPLNETLGCPIEAKPPSLACDFSDWGEWSDCTATCEGQHFRTRHVTSDQASCVLTGGERSLRMTRPCGSAKCWEDSCELDQWSEWTKCSAACGLGVAARTRQVGSVGHAKGCTAALSEVKACHTIECEPVDCKWGDWDHWSGCTNSCGGGTKRRGRLIEAVPQNGGRLCAAEAKAEVAPCNTENCENCIDGAWGVWSEWSKCSATCSPAFRTRHRDLEIRANNCGLPALGAEDEYGLCGELESCDKDQDCEVSEWQNWTTCSNNCFGLQERMRQVVKYASGHGKKCEDLSLKDVKPCNPGPEETASLGCAPDPERSCKIGAWEDWSKCTKRCGGGQQTRQRHILSPAANDGPPCDDALKETAACNTESCDKGNCTDCQWGLWSDWGDCTKCGSQRFRHRLIETMPNHCGQPCNPGAAKETGECKSDCEEKFFCAWSPWHEMNECSASCGFATRMRQRQLSLSKEDRGASNFFTAGENSPCNGNQVDVVDCPVEACKAECEPLPCQFGEWKEWEECSCNQLRQRERDVRTPSKCGGAPCAGPLVETGTCEKECVSPVDCMLGEWQEWSPTVCGATGDQRVRLRRVEQEPANGGKACAGIINETSSCEDHIPLAVDCALRDWESWTSCSASCGGGLKTRIRKIGQLSSNGGRACDGDLEEIHECSVDSCETRHVDCALGQWAQWSSCEGMTTRFRIRMIEVQPEGLGQACSGALKEAEACSDVVDCLVTEWSGWDGCDRTCGGGQHERTREVIRNPRNSGLACPERLVETRGCSEQPCESKDCTVSEWSLWGGCSVACGIGSRTRGRNYTSRPCEDGQGCDLDLEEIKPCAEPPCGCNDCKWGDWIVWSQCSSPCDGGQRARERHILAAPDPGCKPCEAKEKEEIEGCNTQRCHDKVCIDGEWADWQDWEACSASCMGGQTWRARSVKTEANDCGQPAIGLSMEHRPCNVNVPCVASVDCLFDEWSHWSTCTSRCAGLSRRHRNIKQHGKGSGAFCNGPMEQNRHCQVDSGIQDWLEPTMYLDLTTLSQEQSPSGVGGLDSSGALMRFQRVACESGRGETCKGNSVDLVVTPKTSYTGCDMQANGKKGTNLGALNVASGTSVKLEFRLVDSETGDDVPAKELMIKIFDLDEGLGGTSMEKVHARGFKNYELSPTTSIQVEQELSQLTMFSASRYGTDDDDPDDPMQATPVQEAKAVALLYEGAAVVELNFEVDPGSFCKTFLFSARACLSGECKANPCQRDEHHPVDCLLGEWDAWGPCDATCGVGQRIRAREVITEPAYGGRTCSDSLSQTSDCSVKSCQECTPIDCAWEDWSPWSACDKCGGEMKRHRQIASLPSCGGKACTAGSATEIANCTRSCQDKVFCEWGEWQAYGACSATCGKGLKSRTRYLKAFATPPGGSGQRSLLDEGPLGLDSLELQSKYEQLHSRSQRLRASRFQVLALSFVAGCLSLAAVLGAFSRGGRWGRNFLRYFSRQDSYSPAPTDIDFAGSSTREARPLGPGA
mmetsp:Transcript_67684/g.220350  ORF Transcript_67684/g.220350 Transcript_67684/m.220350 type:complete len:2076 (-) Transcript_67684:113-6340(-)